MNKRIRRIIYENRVHGNTGHCRYLFEKTPNWPWPQMNNMGLERPIRLEAEKTYHIQIIADDSIATLYVDGIALNTRMYGHFGDGICISVVDGAAEFSGMSIARELKK